MSDRLPAPYVGMAPYAEEDAPFFFGREKEPGNIIFNLMAYRLTLLYGESGVGKSSLLRAGVVHELRRRARRNIDENGKPEFAVAILNSWRHDPVAELTNAVRESVIQAVDDRTIEQAPPSSSLVETFRGWTDLVGGHLFVILDQFEDYFLYRRHENRDEGFAFEFSRLVNCRDLRVNFLISIREDTYLKLDRFEDIPNVFENMLRIAPLDRTATEAAIRNPIDQYNRFYGAGGKRIGIDDDLVAKVLKGPFTTKAGHPDAAESAAAEFEGVIETPFLQLVMSSLWREERNLGSNRLRLETLDRLGGVDGIVETHLARAIQKLSRKEKTMAAPVFHYLVTPSGHRMCYAVSDLAKQTRLDQRELTALLEKLSDGENRILHPVVERERQDKGLYEISLDALAKPILDWRTRAEERAKFARLRRLMIAGLMAMALLTAGGISYARSERARRQAEEAKRRAVESSNVSSQVLAQLYQVLLGSTDPDTARRDATATFSKLNEVLELYRRDGSPVGEGIALNNIAGFHRFLGESYAAIEDHEQAQSYQKQAQDYYQQAQETLKSALGPDHTEVATSLTGQAVIYVDQGKYADAEILFEESLGILKKALKPDDRSLADAIMNLADCYNSQGKYDAAESAYQWALDIRKTVMNEDHPELATSLYGMAWFYVERGKYSEAEPLFLRALSIWKQDPQDTRDAGMCLDGLSALFREWGKYDEAEQFRDQAQKAYNKVIGKNTNTTAISQDHLLAAYYFENAALLHDKMGRDDTAMLYNFALGILERGLGNDHPDTARNRSNLASFYYRNGRALEAGNLFNQALEVQKALPHSPDLARTLFRLGRLYKDQGKYDQAEPLFKQALAIEETAIPEHPEFANTLDAYAELLDRTDPKTAADETRSRANRIRQTHADKNPGN